MNQTQHNKTSLFLMELIISILFFSVSGAICVELFVKAHTLSQSSVEMNNSVLWVQNISEVFNGNCGNLHSISDFFSDNCIILVSYEDNPEVGTLVMFFDENWLPIDFPTDNGALDDARYELLLCISELPASEVYADTMADTRKMKGAALLGEIVILRMEDSTIIEQIPEKDDPRIVTDRFTDYYIGETEAGENEA